MPNQPEPLPPREQGESPKAFAALLDYLQDGPARSLENLLARYQTNPTAPTHSLRTLKSWYTHFQWEERADFHDPYHQRNAETADQERQRGNLQNGLARPADRIENLKLIYSGLLSYHQLLLQTWLADLENSAGKGDLNRATRFNTGTIVQLRGLLEDIARETGGRAGNPPALPEASSPVDEGPPPNLSLLTSEERQTMISLLEKATPAPDSGMYQTTLPGFQA